MIKRTVWAFLQNQIFQDQNKAPVACGIIARSAGLFQNPKIVCACDGTTIWDEVSKPNSKSSL